MTEPFDFEQHRVRALERYGAIRERYVRYASALESILKMALKEIPTHHIGARAKDIDRFADKASKPDPDDPLRPKYPDPLSDVEDLAGARVIAYVLRALPQIEQVVQREFDVVERSDKGEQLVEKALVGYRSIHYVVQMKQERVKLLEYHEFAELRAEVQIRTILQHAWAEIEHDMRYKPASEPNKELSQRFTALAGLIEVGDREFDQIYEIDERRRRGLRDLAQIREEVPEPADSNRRPRTAADNPLPRVVEPEGPTTPRHKSAALQPKELMAIERYGDAIVAYNALVSKEPRQFAHYLGRAKARFLSGDASGAVADIAEAERLSPNHPFIARVRDLIEGRATDQRPANDQSLAVRQGHTALRDGDAVEALKKYEEAEALGFSPVFSVFNRAMARFVEKKFDLARRTLDRVDPYPGSILEFNVIVLRTLCYLMAGGEKTEEAIELVRNLLHKLMATANYQYNARSPLLDLETGARKSFNEDEWKRISPMFDVVKQIAT
jgi:ppGpp synthetase/RelA/SpoT-type nucleotidyltranferase